MDLHDICMAAVHNTYRSKPIQPLTGALTSSCTAILMRRTPVIVVVAAVVVAVIVVAAIVVKAAIIAAPVVAPATRSRPGTRGPATGLTLQLAACRWMKLCCTAYVLHAYGRFVHCAVHMHAQRGTPGGCHHTAVAPDGATRQLRSDHALPRNSDIMTSAARICQLSGILVRWRCKKWCTSQQIRLHASAAILAGYSQAEMLQTRCMHARFRGERLSWYRCTRGMRP